MRAGTGGMYGWKGSILLEEKKGIDQDKKKKKRGNIGLSADSYVSGIEPRRRSKDEKTWLLTL